MKWKQAIVLTLAVAACLSPGVAFAQGGGKGWLERLSGPGPFDGQRYDFRLVCFYGDSPTERISDHSWLWFDRNSRQEGVGNSCWSDSAPNLRMYVMLEADWFESQENNLQFDSSSDRAEVELVSVKPALMVRLHPTLDVGAGFGLNWFSGDAFDSFFRTSMQPLRVIWTPFAAFNPRNARLRFLRIPLEANVIEGRFTSADFGAPGRFSARNELLWSSGFIIDIWTLVAGNK